MFGMPLSDGTCYRRSHFTSCSSLDSPSCELHKLPGGLAEDNRNIAKYRHSWPLPLDAAIGRWWHTASSSSCYRIRNFITFSSLDSHSCELNKHTRGAYRRHSKHSESAFMAAAIGRPPRPKIHTKNQELACKKKNNRFLASRRPYAS